MIDHLLTPIDVIELSVPMRVGGVYFLIRDDKIIYIGKSIDLYQRLATHRRDRSMDFDRWHFIPCDRAKAKELEADYITAFSPKNNLMGKYVRYWDTHPRIG